jgi:DNA-binding NarL/FixJ family response regulator
MAGIRVDVDLLLIVDDLDSPAAIVSVRDLVARSRCRTVVMTELPECYVWGALLAAGVTEIVSEVASVEQLARVLDRVRAGDPVIARDRRVQLRALWEEHQREDKALLDRVATLSPRERLVLQTLAEGCRPAEIGEQLGVAESTVRTHLRSIRGKLEVDSQLRAALVVHRLESRIPSLDPDLLAPRRSME